MKNLCVTIFSLREQVGLDSCLPFLQSEVGQNLSLINGYEY